MYNESQKMAFVDSKERSATTRKFLIQIFNGFEPYENKWGMDLSLQQAEVLQPVVSELSGLRGKSTEVILIMLKEYVKWLMHNNYPYDKGIYNVKTDSLDKVRNQMVSSPAHLSKLMLKCEVEIGTDDKDNKIIVERGFDKPELETVDVTYRVFLWMAFMGLYDREAIDVRVSDVDLDNLVLVYKGKNYKIYQEAKLDFEKACKLTDFCYIHPNYTTRRNRADGDLLMRGIKSSEVVMSTLRPIINRKLNPQPKGKTIKLKDKLSYRKIYLSGAFYRMFELERMGEEVDFSKLVAKDVLMKKETDRPDYTISATRTLNVITNKMERDYMTDYERWKCAFDV